MPRRYVRTTSKGGVVVVRLRGPQATHAETPHMAAQLREALDRCSGRIRLFVLDLSEIERMTSNGLGMCIDLQRRVHVAGARIVLYGMQPPIDELFELMNLKRLFTIADSAAAVAGTSSGRVA
jgi:anti-anti-sigma factor